MNKHQITRETKQAFEDFKKDAKVSRRSLKIEFLSSDLAAHEDFELVEFARQTGLLFLN